MLETPEKVFLLDLTWQELTEISSEVSKLKNLVWPDLGSNDLKALHSCKKMWGLNVDDDPIPREDMIKILEQMPNVN